MSLVPPNEALVQLSEILGLEDTRDLVRTYLKEYAALVRTMAVGDRVTQHRAAHSLKSSSRYMGLSSLVPLLLALETRLVQPNEKTSKADIEAITNELARVIPALEAFVSDE